jgi:hypothetical protein
MPTVPAVIGTPSSSPTSHRTWCADWSWPPPAPVSAGCRAHLGSCSRWPPPPLLPAGLLTPHRGAPIRRPGPTDPDALLGGSVARLVGPPSRRGYFGQLYAISGWTSLPWVRTLRQPTLVLAGDDDPIVPLVNGRILARRMPQARLHVIHGGGHLFILERPAERAELVAQFLIPAAWPERGPRESRRPSGSALATVSRANSSNSAGGQTSRAASRPDHRTWPPALAPDRTPTPTEVSPCSPVPTRRQPLVISHQF